MASFNVVGSVLELNSGPEGCQFLLNQFGSQLLLGYDLKDGAGFQTKVFPLTAFKSVHFQGGSGFDYVWVHSGTCPLTAVSGGGGGFFSCAKGTRNVFTVGNGDTVLCNKGDTINTLPGESPTIFFL